ncbi:MAG: YdeI/OmpD-associated family protein [Planctomycetota bacterium]
MKNTDPRIDAYIEDAPEYAQPILIKLRKLFHRAEPAIEENIKWGNPTFEYQGIVGGMGAFKEHVAWGFWKGNALKDPSGLFPDGGKASPYAIKVSTVKELPADKVLVAYVKEAVELNRKGVNASPSSGKKKSAKPPARTPADLAVALKLKKNTKAKATFDGFSPSHKRKYIEWLTEAKREETRQKRLATAIEWMAEGKPRNWKYMKKW